MAEGGLMRKVMLGAVVLVLMVVANGFAVEMWIPVGTTVEGEIMFGVHAAEPGSNPNNPNPFLAVRALRNPVGLGGNEIPMKDCIFLGDVVSDISIKRAFFKASRIKCSNAKEPNGSLIKGYAVDRRDNKLGIRGVAGVEDGPAKFVEVPPGEKVYLVIVEGVSITLK